MERQYNLEQFDERADKVLDLAQAEARQFQHNYIGTEHLLLGLVREEEERGGKLFSLYGVTLEKVRMAVQSIIGSGDYTELNTLTFTPRTKQVLKLAVDDAHLLGQEVIAPEHLLLGLIDENEGIAVGVLESLGVDLQTLHNDTTVQALDTKAIFGEDIDEFRLLTLRAHIAIKLARDEARNLQNKAIMPEHLLLGLLREGKEPAAQALVQQGARLKDLRSKVGEFIGRGEQPVTGDISLSPRAREVLEFAIEDAQKHQQQYVGTEHFLLGLLREKQRHTADKSYFGMDFQQICLALTQFRSPIEKKDPATSSTVMRTKNEDRFHKFTERARKALRKASEEAGRLQHHYIGTEHLLLGLISEQKSIAGRALANLGVKLDDMRDKIEFIVGRGELPDKPERGLTPRAKKVVELATDEARYLSQDYIGTEHLLLGLISEGEGIAIGVLTDAGVDVDELRSLILHLIKTSPTDMSQSSATQEDAVNEDIPPIPTIALSLIQTGQSYLVCGTCKAQCPIYFRYCFHCGNNLYG